MSEGGSASDINALDRLCFTSFVAIASINSTSAITFPITFVIATAGGDFCIGLEPNKKVLDFVEELDERIAVRSRVPRRLGEKVLLWPTRRS